jgi:hypothetical protein
MIALPTDVTRSGESAKQAFETVFSAMVSVLERSLKQTRRSPLHQGTGHRRFMRRRHGSRSSLEEPNPLR